jgi:hypothetical protein
VIPGAVCDAGGELVCGDSEWRRRSKLFTVLSAFLFLVWADLRAENALKTTEDLQRAVQELDAAVASNPDIASNEFQTHAGIGHMT